MKITPKTLTYCRATLGTASFRVRLFVYDLIAGRKHR
jgi:hypothetical protein